MLGSSSNRKGQGSVLFGTIVGAMLPLILRAFRLDPASASAPAVATIVDVSGLIIILFNSEGVYARSSTVTHNSSAPGEKHGR